MENENIPAGQHFGSRRQQQLRRFSMGLCILCGLCLIMDGFDVQAMGYVAPVILKEWHVPNASSGPCSAPGCSAFWLVRCCSACLPIKSDVGPC